MSLTRIPKIPTQCIIMKIEEWLTYSHTDALSSPPPPPISSTSHVHTCVKSNPGPLMSCKLAIPILVKRQTKDIKDYSLSPCDGKPFFSSWVFLFQLKF